MDFTAKITQDPVVNSNILLMWLLWLVFISGICGQQGGNEVPKDQQARAIVTQAVKLAHSGDINLAMDLCYQSLELHPHADSHHLLSQLHLAKADVKKSLMHIEEAVKLDSSDRLQVPLLFHRGLFEILPNRRTLHNRFGGA